MPMPPTCWRCTPDNSDEHDYTSWSAISPFQEQAYRWSDISEIREQETPSAALGRTLYCDHRLQ